MAASTLQPRKSTATSSGNDSEKFKPLQKTTDNPPTEEGEAEEEYQEEGEEEQDGGHIHPQANTNRHKKTTTTTAAKSTTSRRYKWKSDAELAWEAKKKALWPQVLDLRKEAESMPLGLGVKSWGGIILIFVLCIIPVFIIMNGTKPILVLVQLEIIGTFLTCIHPSNAYKELICTRHCPHFFQRNCRIACYSIF